MTILIPLSNSLDFDLVLSGQESLSNSINLKSNYFLFNRRSSGIYRRAFINYGITLTFLMLTIFT